jgi:hypothetical protein
MIVDEVNANFCRYTVWGEEEGERISPEVFSDF